MGVRRFRRLYVRVFVLPLILFLFVGFYALLVGSGTVGSGTSKSWLLRISGCHPASSDYPPSTGEGARIGEGAEIKEGVLGGEGAGVKEGILESGDGAEIEERVLGKIRPSESLTVSLAPAGLKERPPLVPVLMYHVIGDNDGPLKGLYVSKQDFTTQVRMLKEKGYETIRMNDLFDFLNGKEELPVRPVVMTFDDGYESVYRDAYPILKNAGFVATLFLQTKLLGRPGGLSANAVREMLDYGFDLGAHTINHPDLTQCNPSQLEREVAGSKRALEEAFGVPVLWFAYPAGRYDETVVRAVARAGYLMGFTTRHGFVEKESAEFLILPRIRVDRSDGAGGLLKKLGVEEDVHREETPGRYEQRSAQ